LANRVLPFDTLSFRRTVGETELIAGYYIAEVTREGDKPEAEISFERIARLLSNLGLPCTAEGTMEPSWLSMPAANGCCWAFGNMDGPWTGNFYHAESGEQHAFLSIESLRPGVTCEVKIAGAIALCFQVGGAL
jgi:hypothetical protein